MNKKPFVAPILMLAVLLAQFSPAPLMARAATCDAALFVADVTAPDGSTYSPNAPFTKPWRLKNIGTCTWTTAYKLVFASGVQMGGPGEVNLSSTVAPNTTVDLSVNLTAPVPAGTYRGYWQLKNAAGTLFGIGATADKPFWVEIITKPGSDVTPVPVGDSYDFASQAGKVQSWLSGAGLLSFPGTDGDAKGFAMKLDSVQLETGTTVNQPTLLMVPQNKTDGYIQGLYPSLAIQNGDHFQATIGCQYGATSCYMTYRIDYRTSAGTKTLWLFKEKYEGLTYNVNLDLSFLAGKNVEFFLLVLASGSPTGDRALWVAPRIVRAGGGTAATATATPLHGNWLTYTNPKYQFQFQYPPEGQLSNALDNAVHIDLPRAPGTNLTSKYLDMSVTENVSSCSSLPVGGGPSQQVTFNGITFTKQSGVDQGAGQIREWTLYYTVKGNACIAMGFVLHSGTLGAFPTEIVQFNFDAESAVFAEMMSTFTWLSSASTGSYSVVGVTDTLNVRSKAGADSPLVASLAYNANNVIRTGASSTVGSAE